MLGCALALKYPFKDHTISLTGFSLGTQVVKSCLGELYRIGATDIVQNVTLLGGATCFGEKKKQELWVNKFSQVVNGKIKNVHTNKDIILILYNIT